MYRAVSFYMLENNVSFQSLPENQLIEELDKINIEFRNTLGRNAIFLNGQNIDEEIRSGIVSKIVSEVAAISSIRSKLVKMQQEYSINGGLVMDGRDIGSVVFPNADLKFFITADVEIRAQRRFIELKDTKNELSLLEIIDNLKHRDHIDSTRDDSPLTLTKDAIIIDTSHHTRESQLELALSYIERLDRQKQQ